MEDGVCMERCMNQVRSMRFEVVVWSPEVRAVCSCPRVVLVVVSG